MLTTIVDDLRAVGGWLGRELRLILGWLREAWLWLALVCGALLAALAYLAPASLTLAVGGDVAAHLRGFDEPFLRGFNASEPDRKDSPPWWALPEPPYRWAEPESEIRLPAVGDGVWLVSLTLSREAPADVQLTPKGGQSVSLPVGATRRRYLVPVSASMGDLALALRTERFVADDRRQLGVVVYRLSAAPLGGTARTPATGQLALHTLILAAAYLTARRLGLGARASGMLVAGIGLVLALLLVQDRLGLTIATPHLAILVGACLGLAWPLSGALAAGARALGVVSGASERGGAVGVTLTAFLARMVGVTHPYALFNDLGFNVNNLLRFTRGELFLIAGLPCEAGAGRAPYPPAQYLTLAPAQLLFDPGNRGQLEHLIQGGCALFESMGALFIWMLLRRAGAGRVAAVLGAALYILPLPLLQAYSIGEMANLFGQALVPPLLLFLSAWPPRDRKRRWAIPGGILLAMLLLSHVGITISTLALLAAWGVVQLAGLWGFRAEPQNRDQRPKTQEPRTKNQEPTAVDHRGLTTIQPTNHQPPATSHQPSSIVPLVLAGGAAALVALALFYSAYLYLPAINREQAAMLAAQGQFCPPGHPFGEKLVGTISLGVGPTGSLPIPLLVAAVAGALSTRRNVAGLLGAAALGTLLSFATLVTSDQPVRWAHFLYPVLCVGGGLGLAAWWRRGRAGLLLALLALGSVLWFGADGWVRKIADYLH